MKAAADAGADVHSLVLPARALARWARTLPTMFPAGTNLPISKALPAVWSDRAGFEARAAAYAAAAQALAEAAQSRRPRRLPHPLGASCAPPAAPATTPIVRRTRA